jgi:hypothetical protein
MNENKDIINTEFWQVILTGTKDAWNNWETHTWVHFIWDKAKRISDGRYCLVNLTKKPKNYIYDIVFY